MKIAIIGAGTAGCASALFLSRAGHDVVLFERVPNPGPVGAGIMMQPSGMLVLERLGCVAPILERGSRVDALVVQNTRGRKLMELRYAELVPSLYGVGLHRGVLFETLMGAVRSSRVDLRLGVEIRTLTELRGFDLVVLADGARSHVRSLARMTCSVTPYPWGALWFIGKFTTPMGELRQFVEGTARMIGVLPTGHDVASLFFSVRVDRKDEVLRDGLDAWKKEVLRVAPVAEELVEQIHAPHDLTLASYYDVSMPRWHADRVVLIGDCAHATSPQLGQGCNLALCDAAALADAIATHENVHDALDAYTHARREHLAFYQLATRALTPLFQSDYAPLGVLRDFLTPIATTIPFVRREMLRSMAGTKTGWLWGSMDTRMPITGSSTDP